MTAEKVEKKRVSESVSPAIRNYLVTELDPTSSVVIAATKIERSGGTQWDLYLCDALHDL